MYLKKKLALEMTWIWFLELTSSDSHLLITSCLVDPTPFSGAHKFMQIHTSLKIGKCIREDIFSLKDGLSQWSSLE